MLVPEICGRPIAGHCDLEKMLGRDPSTPPIVGRGGIPSVEEKGTNMQGGDKVFGVFLEGRHKVARPILKKKK